MGSAHSLGFRQGRYIGTTVDGGLRGHHTSSKGAVAVNDDDSLTKPPSVVLGACKALWFG